MHFPCMIPVREGKDVEAKKSAFPRQKRKEAYELPATCPKKNQKRCTTEDRLIPERLYNFLSLQQKGHEDMTLSFSKQRQILT